MITHNGKYLLHATHHGMPIYAATMGGKMVIGGWLLSATLQAIVAAFGAEGIEVIAKTNDYLNRIATTDPQRAQALAGFINEDPMLVCSLVETSKTRWLKKDVKENYFDLGVILHGESTGVRVSYKLESTNLGQDVSIFGARAGYGNNDYSINFGAWAFGTFYIGYKTCHSEPKVPTDTEKHIVTINKGLVSVDDWSKDYGVQSFSTPTTARLFDNANGDNHPCSPLCWIDKCEMWEDDVPSHTFVPYRDPSTGEMELLDILTGNLATRVGTFTEQLTSKTTETTS